MTRVLIGQSYYLRFDPKLYRAMQPYPPLGTLWAASYVRQHGDDVDLFDAMLEDSETRWAEALERYRPDVAVLFEDKVLSLQAGYETATPVRNRELHVNEIDTDLERIL